MSIAVGLGRSTESEAAAAVAEAVEQARSGLDGRRPSVAAVATTVDHDVGAVDGALREALPGVSIHGATTSLGVLGSDGVLAGANGAVGVMLLAADEPAHVATGSAPIDGDAREAGRRAARRITNGGTGAAPKVLFMNASPGQEEDVLAGVADVFADVPVYGGSAADHAIAGEWSVLTDDGPVGAGVSLLALSGAVGVGAAFGAPYTRTEHGAEVTRAEDRTLHEIGGRSAGEVLQSWVGDSIATQAREGGNILAQTALRPLALVRSTEAGDKLVLVHPAHLHASGAVDVFARTAAGDRLCSMRGSVDELTSILTDLTRRALQDGDLDRSRVRGGLLIYCAGCAGAVGERIDEGLRHVAEELGDVPVLGYCTFGEQGHVDGLGNVHADLSMALLLLADPA